MEVRASITLSWWGGTDDPMKDRGSTVGFCRLGGPVLRVTGKEWIIRGRKTPTENPFIKYFVEINAIYTALKLIYVDFCMFMYAFLLHVYVCVFVEYISLLATIIESFF